ncbi:MAG: hypothetical protein H0X24_24085 [Ktedonobacterales bacterium]|nr:hypothetical protein [Ktedonobacterales bacterium]
MSQSRGQPGTPTQRRRPQGSAVPAPSPTRSQIEQVTARTLGSTAVVSFVIMAALAAIVVLSSLFITPKGTALTSLAPTPIPTQPPAPFDPGADAALPNNRIVAFYGYVFSGIDFNGPVSTKPFSFLPKLQQVGQQYAAADPKHPVKLGIDLVVDTWTGCGVGLPVGCNALSAPQWIQAYIDYCQQNNLLLFLDLQFGKADVRALVSQMLPYLERYPFIHLALDTEFHFYPNQPNPGVFDLGHVDGADINWVIDQLSQLPALYHIPRKVLIIHQYIDGAITNRNKIKTSPLVSTVLHIDGFGVPDQKIAKYNSLAVGLPTPYSGFKLFFSYPDCPVPSLSCGAEQPIMTPAQVLAQLKPAPLVVTYQ